LLFAICLFILIFYYKRFKVEDSKKKNWLKSKLPNGNNNHILLAYTYLYNASQKYKYLLVIGIIIYCSSNQNHIQF